ncbi:hypothetical protein PQ610_00770 [Tardisphaera miroshnichenkoae]
MSEQIRAKARLTDYIIVAVITILAVFFGEILAMTSGSYSGSIQGLFIPFIYIVILIEVFARYSKRLRLNPTQYVLLMIPLFMATGNAYTVNGTAGNTANVFYWVIQSAFGAFPIAGIASPASSSALATLEMLPSFVVPHSVHAASILWNGLTAGESIPWGAYAGPIVFWSLLMIIVMFMGLGMSFTLTGPQWTETERLVFPVAVPTVYMINQATSRDDKGHSSLLSLKVANMKYFWVSLLVGALIGLIPLIVMVVPGAASSWSFLGTYGAITLNLGTYTASMLPGSEFGAVVLLPLIGLGILLPYETLITAVATWIAIPVIYDDIAVRLGWVAYTSGAENYANWVYGEEPPFAYQTWAWLGLALGVGLYFAWMMRGRIKKVLGTLVGPTYYQGDFSVKTGAWVLVGSSIIFYVMMLVMGVNWLMGIFWIVLYYLWAIMASRVIGEYWWRVPPALLMWQLYWPVGAGLGLWTSAPAQQSGSLMALNTVNESVGGWSGAAFSPFGPVTDVVLYKIASDTKSSIKDVFRGTILATVIGVPLVVVLSVWLFAHIGYTNSAMSWVTAYTNYAMNAGITGSTVYWSSSSSFTANWGWTIGGIVLIFILMWLRGAFSWFMFDPVMFMLALYDTQFVWFTFLIALALKYGLSKALGPRRTEEAVIPIASGFAIGTGVPLLILGIYATAIQVLPFLASTWKP